MELRDITFVILTFNEAKRLGPTLAALPAAAKAFVLDAFSLDDTVAIAQANGAQVEQRAWSSFAEARRYAISRVTTPWLFMLDADELVTPALATAILEADPHADGYRCTRLNRFCGRIMLGGAWAQETVLRLVPTANAQVVAQAAGGLHEALSISGESRMLAGALEHDSYPTLASYWEKFHRYTTIEAEHQEASLLTVLGVITLALLRAAWQLLYRQGYRDGWRGFFVAYANAAYQVRVKLLAWRRGSQRRADRRRETQSPSNKTKT